MNHAKEEMKRRMSLGRMESVFTSCSSVRETLSIWLDGWLVKGGVILRPWCVASEESVSEKGYSISGHSESSVEPCEMGWIGLKYTTSASKPCLCALWRNVGYCACQWGGRFSSGLQRVYRTLGVGVFCMCVYLYLHVCFELRSFLSSRSMGGIFIEYCFLSSEVPWKATETMWDGNYISCGQREKSQPHFHLLTLMTENQCNTYYKELYSKNDCWYTRSEIYDKSRVMSLVFVGICNFYMDRHD